ncbi:succinylglutamate desuccinylase/aspartoacylase family protein [Candidatus Poribacteria bacterium]|nr:succinylglutamate desuccinylase/aspartoacylase family protein [Candidatus Poribacteria bacterium]
MLVVLAGVHGNEWSGVHAGRRVLAKLAELNPAFRGDLVVIAGNLTALSRHSRFLDRDLNRMWSRERIEALRKGTCREEETIEHRELAGLIEAMDGAFSRACGLVHVLDLHTSSADGEPFGLLRDGRGNRRFAFHFPVPLLLGLEEYLEGVSLEYLSGLGCICAGIEAGQHELPSSVDRNEAAIWTALLAAGNIETHAVPEADRAREMLAGLTRKLPRVLEIRHRHAIAPGAAFKMNPGYKNFQRVHRGELVAHDKDGPISAPQDGLMVMPLYQGLGDDGYFLAVPVSRWWLALSALARRMNLDKFLRWLPGVQRQGDAIRTHLVPRGLALLIARPLFHLCGYRQTPLRDGRWAFHRKADGFR